MQRLAIALLCLGSLFGAVSPGAAQTPFRPVATVNSSMITAYDVDQRARIIDALGGSGLTDQQLANAALDQLIEDRLKSQAAERVGLESSPAVIEQGVAEFAEQLGTTPEALTARLSGAGVTDQAIEDMVSGQMLWREVVRQRFRGRIELGEAEIDAEIALVTSGGGTRYRLQEIGLPDTAEGRTFAETEALAARLFRELSAGGDFTAAVRDYSTSPSRARGGDLGWIDSRTLPEGTRRMLEQVQDGGVLAPQRVPGGFTIMRLVERQAGGVDGAVDDPELRERVRRELLSRRLDLLSQGLLQELRRDAMIELR